MGMKAFLSLIEPYFKSKFSLTVARVKAFFEHKKYKQSVQCTLFTLQYKTMEFLYTVIQ